MHTCTRARTHTQFGFISFPGEGWKQESVFFHMNSLMSGCEFSDLRTGDEVEFMLTFNQKTQKRSAIHVRRLRYVVCTLLYAVFHTCTLILV